jgi:hypothetical protein
MGNRIFNTLLQKELISILFLTLNKFSINKTIDNEGKVNNEINMIIVDASLFLIRK